MGHFKRSVISRKRESFNPTLLDKSAILENSWRKRFRDTQEEELSLYRQGPTTAASPQGRVNPAYETNTSKKQESYESQLTREAVG